MREVQGCGKNPSEVDGKSIRSEKMPERVHVAYGFFSGRGIAFTPVHRVGKQPKC